MDTQAYVLIGTRHGTVKDVAEKLLEHKEIVNIHILYGQHDIIIQVRVHSNKELDNFMVNKIKSITDIERTETMIVADSPMPLE